ncbi:DUF1289 domain-containing protein [Agrobacterium sp. BA1120]|uniref:DUF1289 domain-containing protein n=1 Tax=Agrobacterium sp. BA1120 TaxID=3228927 RepID=UPI000DDCF218
METPCINVCTLDPQDGLCDGCHRSIDEIMAWSRYSNAERSQIMADLPGRLAARNTGNTEETANA